MPSASASTSTSTSASASTSTCACAFSTSGGSGSGSDHLRDAAAVGACDTMLAGAQVEAEVEAEAEEEAETVKEAKAVEEAEAMEGEAEAMKAEAMEAPPLPLLSLCSGRFELRRGRFEQGEGGRVVEEARASVRPFSHCGNTFLSFLELFAKGANGSKGDTR